MLIAVLVVAVVIGIATFAYISIENSTIELSNPTVLGSSQYSTDLQFGSVADMAVRGSCPSVNGVTTSCDLLVAVSLNNMNLATKTMGFTLLNGQLAQLAIASGQNIPEATPVRVSYGEDSSGAKSAELTLPVLVGGSTWNYDFLIFNPPAVDGNTTLNLVLDAEVVPTSFIGHSYQLQAQIQLPSS